MPLKSSLVRTGVLVLAAASASSAAAQSGPNPFKRRHTQPVQVALIGDVPYRDADILKLDEVIREINESGVDLTLHSGDIKSGSSTCADELLQQRFDQLAQLQRPLIYTPGDNEWTD